MDILSIVLLVSFTWMVCDFTWVQFVWWRVRKRLAKGATKDELADWVEMMTLPWQKDRRPQLLCLFVLVLCLIRGIVDLWEKSPWTT